MRFVDLAKSGPREKQDYDPFRSLNQAPRQIQDSIVNPTQVLKFKNQNIFLTEQYHNVKVDAVPMSNPSKVQK